MHMLTCAAKESPIETTADICDMYLVAAAKDGDHQAYAELCRRHSKQILRTVLRITRDVADPEDKASSLCSSRESSWGFGGGALLVRTLILGRLMFLGKTRIFALSLFYLVLYSSELLYPTAMGWISDTLCWNYAFLLDFPFFAIGAFLIWKYAPRGHLYLPNEKTCIDSWGG